MKKLLALLFAALPILAAWGQDYGRERRWADEVVPAIVVGDPVWLELGNGRRFLSLFAEGRSRDTAILLVHGVGVHPDHGVIGTLRSKLNDFGYATLSAQMPVARSEGATVDDYYPALFPEAGERMAVAARFLRSKGHERIVLLAHSMGAWMANVHLLEAPEAHYAAWIVLGLTGRFWGASLVSVPWLDIEWLPGRVRLPILDIQGEADLPAVLAGTRSRANALAHIPGSRQVTIAGADHHYSGRESALARAIHDYLSEMKSPTMRLNSPGASK